MKYLAKFIILIFVLVSCGKSPVSVKLANNGDPSSDYQQPNVLTIDTNTITSEIDLSTAIQQSSFIKDFSKIEISLANSSYAQKGKTLYIVNLIDELGVKIDAGKIVQDLVTTSSYKLTRTAFQLRAIDLDTKKVIYSKVFDNHFNQASYLPSKDGEFWTVKSIELNSELPVVLYRKSILGGGCPGGLNICSKVTNEFAVATLDLNTANLKFVKTVSGEISGINSYRGSIYYYTVANKSLTLSRLNTFDMVTTNQTVPLHKEGVDHLRSLLFYNDSLYLSGRWDDERMSNSLELMKFDLDLTENPVIAFDNFTSGPDGNIDVIDDGKYIVNIKRLSSMNENIVVVSSEFNITDKKWYYDIYLVNKTSGELAEYFNGKASLRREYVKNEAFYNDDNNIYFLNYNKDSITIDSINKGGVANLINNALSAKIDFNVKFINPIVTFFKIQNGVANIVIYDQHKYYLKSFNIH